MVKYYQRPTTDFKASAPTLWIYDEGIFKPDSKLPPQLVWRMNVTPLKTGEPINELVLVNAKTGNISLHLNQVDTFLPLQDDPAETPAPTVTDIPTDVPAETDIPTNVPTTIDTPLVPTPSSQPTNTAIIIPTETSIAPTSSPLPTHAAVPPTLTLIPTSMDTPTPTGSLNLNPMIINAGASIIRYVSTSGNDNSNTCTTSSSPCRTIQQAVNEFNAGDTIDVASGVYKAGGVGNVVVIGKSLTLSGGWNSTFTTQIGASTIDGQNTNQGRLLNNAGTTISIDRFVIENTITGDGVNLSLRCKLDIDRSNLRK